MVHVVGGVGAPVGAAVGAAVVVVGVGAAVGALVGAAVGAAVGVEVGAGVGHACVLHTRCASVGHSLPPWACATVTITGCTCVPLPHEAVQVLHAPSVNSQWMGHACTLQFCVSVRSVGHAWPP